MYFVYKEPFLCRQVQKQKTQPVFVFASKGQIAVDTFMIFFN